MSSNLLRTIIAAVTLGLGVVMQLFGCSTSDVGITTCTAAWLTPQLMAWVIMGIGAAHLILKAMQGWVGLTAPTVPVVPAAAAGPGTVTATQVAAPAAKK